MKKIICLVYISIIFLPVLAQREQDSLALVALYNSTDGENWQTKTNWLSSQPISTWYGITVTNNRVSSISLTSNWLRGLLPKELWDLTYLNNLNLSGNDKLKGSIPSEIGEMTNLTLFGLESCQLTGSIPPEIGNLTNLEYLFLTYNHFTGSIPSEIGNLTKLKDLYLSNNQLTGPIPSEIGNLKNLDGLYFSSNQLTGSIPPEIGSLTNLVYLDLDFNQLTGPIPKEIGNLTNLIYLRLLSNHFTGSIPSELWSLTNLAGLYLSDTQITPGPIPSEIGNLTNLQYLYLSHNQFTGTIPTTIGNLKSLNGLDLSDNLLTGSIPQVIGDMTTLSELNFSNNLLTGSIPSELWSLTNLVVLYLSNNQFTTGSIPSEIGNITYLTFLDLSHDQFTGTIPTTIGNLNWLRYLDLSSNLLSGSIPPEIGNLTRLRNLYLSDNRLTGSIPPIGNLFKLMTLSLNDNLLSGAIPIEINNLHDLEWLKLNSNRITLLPALTLGSLDSLWIQNNRLSFSDIEPNINVPKKFFKYSPQDSIGIKKDTSVCTKSNLLLVINTGGSDNIYKWYRNDTIIPAATRNSYQISDISQSDSGSYRCNITNTLVPDLILYSRAYKIEVKPSPGQYSISGNSSVSEDEEDIYFAPINNGVNYSWYSVNGRILSYPSVNSVRVQWGSEGDGYVGGFSLNQSVCVSDTVRLKVDIGPTGIANGYANKIKIYPNPTKDCIFINTGDYETNSNYTIKIFNNAGKELFEIKLEELQFGLDLSKKVAKGMYFIDIKDYKGVTILVQKIILL